MSIDNTPMPETAEFPSLAKPASANIDTPYRYTRTSRRGHGQRTRQSSPGVSR